MWLNRKIYESVKNHEKMRILGHFLPDHPDKTTQHRNMAFLLFCFSIEKYDKSSKVIKMRQHLKKRSWYILALSSPIFLPSFVKYVEIFEVCSGYIYIYSSF